MCAGLAVVSGCKKQEAAAPPGEPQKSTEGLVPEATKAVEGAKSAATQVTEQVTTQAKAVEQQATPEAQGLIDRAKSLVSEQKYQDALASLNQLTNLKLTPEQQKVVDDLKAQIQAALAKATGSGSNAASAVQGILGGKK